MIARRPSFRGRPSPRIAVVGLCVLLISAAQPAVAARISAPRPRTATVQAAVPLSSLIGQKLVVAMRGTTPSDDLLGRIGRGEVGGVILFSANIRSATQLAQLTRRLRAAASSGGQPPLLITTDQEGGLVKRVPWAPPTLSPPQMGANGSTSTAFAQGKSTGHVLACAGVNGNLAPVADVPISTDSFLYQQGRTWSFDASLTAALADAFASGLEAGANVPAMKHFPGLGRATRNTDTSVVTLGASATQLAPGLRPYRSAIDHHLPLVMLSNATYRAYDRYHAAGWSHAISVGLLRDQLGFAGVSITDSLNGTAAARGVSPSSLAVKAAAAGTDMILLTGSESDSQSAHDAMVAAAAAGLISVAVLRASYNRILAMKAAFPALVSDLEPPVVRPPIPSLVAGTVLGTTSAVVNTRWSALDHCGISAYALTRRTALGSWVPQTLPAPSTTALNQALRFGVRYAYSVMAMDGAGNESGDVRGVEFRPRPTQESDPTIRFRGNWGVIGDDQASGGAFATSSAGGATASMSFTGISVAWVALRGPSRGSASVYLDGAFAGHVDLGRSVRLERAIVFARAWSYNGPHRITIVNLGTVGRSHVDVDAFLTLIAA